MSVPTEVFRGFGNVGDGVGYMFAVLGGDDPGHVTWWPYVFESAAKYGLLLMEDGSLIDTTKGETVADGKKPMAATTKEDVARCRRLTGHDITGWVGLNREVNGESGSEP